MSRHLVMVERKNFLLTGSGKHGHLPQEVRGEKWNKRHIRALEHKVKLIWSIK